MAFNRYYPFETKEEKDAALMDTLAIVVDIFPQGGSMFKALRTMGQKIAFKDFIDGVENFRHAVRKWVSDALDIANDWIDFEDLKAKAIEAGIKGGVNQLNKNLKAQYPWIGSIEVVDYTIEGLTSALGDWFADVINNRLSVGVGHEVQAFSSFYPPDKIVPELDAFLTDEINTKTGLNLSSIVQNPNLKNELRDAVQTKFAQAIADKVAAQKARLIDDMANLEIYGASKAQRIKTIDSIVQEVIDMILQKKVIGFNFDGKAYIQQNYKKALNRKHQAAYRKLHREQRHWVLKD